MRTEGRQDRACKGSLSAACLDIQGRYAQSRTVQQSPKYSSPASDAGEPVGFYNDFISSARSGTAEISPALGAASAAKSSGLVSCSSGGERARKRFVDDTRTDILAVIDRHGRVPLLARPASVVVWLLTGFIQGANQSNAGGGQPPADGREGKNQKVSD